jgi:hypothetical protein
MPAVSIPSNPALPKPNDADFEPDNEWKRQLRKRIEESLESMVKDVKNNQAAQLRKQVVTKETRLQLEEEYKQAMVNIKRIASEQYHMMHLGTPMRYRPYSKGAHCVTGRASGG